MWTEVLRRNPGARLNLFGGDQPKSVAAVDWRPAPPSSIDLFHPAAILAVPLRIASGIRMKILEAWARGVPVVATPEAVRGLEGAGEPGFLLARDGAEFADAIGRIHRRRELADRLVGAGRAALAARHEPGRVTASLEAVYRDVLGGIATGS